MNGRLSNIRLTRRGLRAVRPRDYRLLGQTPHFASTGGTLQRGGETKHLDTPLGPIMLTFQVSRWEPLLGGPGKRAGDAILQRRLFGVFRAGPAGEEVGAVELLAYEIGPEVSNEDLAERLDGDSRDASELGKALVAGWEDVAFQLGSFGAVIDFRHIWIRQAYARSSWWIEVAESLVEHMAKRRAAVFANLYALEYAAGGALGTGDQGRLTRRKAALVRFCSGRLGMTPFRGSPAGEVCWAWRADPRSVNHIDPPENTYRPT